MLAIQCQGHQRPVTSIKFNRNGDCLYTAAKDGVVLKWHVQEGTCLGNFVGEIQIAGARDRYGAAVNSVDPTHDDKLLLVTGGGSNVGIYDACTGSKIDEIMLDGPGKSIEWCRCPKQDKFIVAVRSIISKPQSEHKLMIGKREHGAMTQVPIETEDMMIPLGTEPASHVFWGPYDEMIISVHDSTIILWDAFNHKIKKQFQAHDKEITDVTFNRERSMCMTVSRDKKIKMWNVFENFTLIKELQSDVPLNCGSIHPYVSGEEADAIRPKVTIRDHKGGEMTDLPPDLNKQLPIRPHCIVAGGASAAEVTTVGAHNFEAQVYNLALGNQLALLDTASIGPLNCISYFPNGKGFASGGEDSTIRIFHFDDKYLYDIEQGAR